MSTAKKVMETKEIDGMLVQPCKCCFNGSKGVSDTPKGSLFYPEVFGTQDLFYARCSNPNCHAFDMYEFIGVKKKAALENWNLRMMPPKESN